MQERKISTLYENVTELQEKFLSPLTNIARLIRAPTGIS